MNLAQTKIYLEKIIALYKSMSADERNISPIERDLMLSYIRQLYETCLDNTPSVSAAVQTPAPVKPTPAPPKVEAPRIVEVPKVEVPVAAPPSDNTRPIASRRASSALRLSVTDLVKSGMSQPTAAYFRRRLNKNMDAPTATAPAMMMLRGVSSDLTSNAPTPPRYMDDTDGSM